MAAADLPIAPYRFYEQFLSVESSCLQDHHRASGQSAFRSTPWRPDGGGSGALRRVFTFVQPKRGVASMPARCTQRHGMSMHAGGVVALTTDMQPAGIPYAEAFRVQSFWTVGGPLMGGGRAWFLGWLVVWGPGCEHHQQQQYQPQPPKPPNSPTRQVCPDAAGTGCRVEIRVAVPFSRWCVLKGVITGASLADCREFFVGFLDKAAAAAAEIAAGEAGAATAAAGAAGVSPFAAVAAAGGSGGVDAEVFLRRRAPPPPRPAARAPSRTLSAAAKASFALPPAHPAAAATVYAGLSARQLAHLAVLLLAVLLLLQAVALWELFVLRQRLAAALPGAFGPGSGVGGGWLGVSRLEAAGGEWVAWVERLFAGRLGLGAALANGGLGGDGSGITSDDL